MAATSSDPHPWLAPERDGVPHKSGVFELLDFLDERKIPRALQPRHRPKSLSTSSIGLASVIASTWWWAVIQVQAGKPAPDIYWRAAELLECAAAECVALEDSGPGIRAAAAAGMNVIWIPDLCEVELATQQLAFAVLPSLSEAKGLFEQLTR